VPGEKKWGRVRRAELKGRAEVWHDFNEKRLYAVTQIAPEGVAFLDTEGLGVRGQGLVTGLPPAASRDIGYPLPPNP